MSKYRYLLSYTNGASVFTDVQFFPVEDKVVIKYSKEKGKYFFIKEFSGSLIFRNDQKKGITDYTKLMTVTDPCVPFYLEVQKQNGNSWISGWWTGVFTKYDSEVDQEACTITVTPARDDELVDLDAILEKEVNVLATGDEVIVEIQNSSVDPTISGYPVLFYETETYVDDVILTDIDSLGTPPTDATGRPLHYHSICADRWQIPPGAELIPPISDYCTWELYSVKYELLDMPTYLYRVTTVLFTTFFLFWKDVSGCVPPDSTFKSRDVNYFGNLEICSYRRHPYYVCNNPTWTFNSDTYTFTYLGTNNFTNIDLRSGRLLTPVIEEMLSDIPLDYQSKFFTDSLNPVTGLENQLKELVLVPNSEVNNYIPTNRARRELLTLKQLLDDLFTLFQVGYTVESGTLILEHCSYFENGGSYTGTKTVGTDLTQLINPTTKGTYITKSNKYEYNRDDIVDKEHFANYTGEMNIQVDAANTEMMLPICNADFSQMDITYDNCKNNGKSTDRTTEKISPDWIRLMFNYDPQQRGFCLFSTRYDRDSISIGGTTYNIDVYACINEYSPLSQTYIPNGHLGWGSLHLAYWKHGRVRQQGYMVGQLTDFLSYQKLKIQKPLTFHNCSIPFDPDKLIVTGLGTGEVVEAEEDFQKETITVTLKYD